jgi:hypothetical protein
VKAIILLEVAKYSKILFHHLIGDFSGTIGFGVKSSGQADVHPKNFTQMSPKLGGKLGAAI